MAVYRLTVDLAWSGASGSPGANVWHFRDLEPDVANGTLNDAIDALEDFYTAIKGLLPSDMTMKFGGEAVTESTGDDNPTQAAGLHSWTVQGTSGGGYMPPANQFLLSMRTAHYGRSGRGRKFIGPLVVANAQDNGTPKEANRLILQNAATDNLVTPFAAPGNGAFVVYSRTQRQAYDVTRVTVPNEFGVLRSRRD